jgi:hypothetical protein
MLCAARRVDSQYQAEKVVEGVPDAGIRQFVSSPATFVDSHHQTAATEAREVIRHDLARYPDVLGQLGRIARRPAQSQQDLCPRRIRQRITEAGQGVGVNQCLHNDQSTAFPESSETCITIARPRRC